MFKRALWMVVLLMLAGAKSTFAAAEVIKYDVLLFGDKIGTLTISHEVKADGSEVYLLDSYSKAKILWTMHENVSHYEVVYKAGKLQTSKFKEVENGEVKRWNNISFDGKQYNVDGYKGKRSFTETPVCSVVSIYFKGEPTVSRIFYEAEGDFSSISKTEPNTWEFKSSDGNRNVYHYVNGKAQSMEFHVSIATVKMVRVN